MEIDAIEMIAGHPALDFVNTVEGRGSAELLNYLPDYERFAGWCVRADFVTRIRADALTVQAVRHPIVAERVWARAMAWREGLNDVVRRLAAGEAPGDHALAVIDAEIVEAHGNRRLVGGKAGSLHWIWRDRHHGLAEPLWTLALAAAELVTDADNGSRIKICANGPCDWVFLDTSRNGRRRWCRMHVCGNASKVRRFRERQRG